MSSSPPAKRRRNRMVVVCQRCRKKKAKCDKNSPCDQCIKAKHPEECYYEQNMMPSKKEASEQLAKSVKERMADIIFGHGPSSQENLDEFASKLLLPEHNKYLIGENPMVSASDMMNLHMVLSQARKSSGSSTAFETMDYMQPRFTQVYQNFKTSQRLPYLVELSQQEPSLKLYWKCNANTKKLKLMTLSHFNEPKRTEVVKMTSRYYGHQFIFSNQQTPAAARKQLSDFGLPLGFTFAPDFSESEDYHVSLARVLPIKPVFFIYLHRFFEKIYPIYPIIDEEWLFTSVQRIFCFSPDGTFHSVNVLKREDMIIISVVLFILRLSYLSCLTNSRYQNEEILDSMLIKGVRMRNYPISLNVVDLAKSLFHKGSYRMKASIVLLQANLLRLVHQMMSFDNEIAFRDTEGDTGSASVTSLAITLLLERDPDNIINFPGDERERNLRRKIWYTIIQIDWSMTLLFFTPRSISPKSYSTKLPRFSAQGSNLRDLELEERTIAQFNEFQEIMAAGNDLLDISVDMKSKFRAVDVVHHLNQFEKAVYNKLGCVDDYIKKREPEEVVDVFPIIRVKMLICFRLHMGYIYYFLFIYYKYKGENSLSFHFIKKTVITIFGELGDFCSELMLEQKKYFDTSFALVATPIILILQQAIAIISLHLGISLNCGIIQHVASQGSSELLVLMKEAYKRVDGFAARSQKTCKMLSERYFYAWKCSKINASGYRVVSSDGLYSIDPESLKDATDDWTKEKLIDIMRYIPVRSKIEVEDESLLREHCYYSKMALTDVDLEGPDLYKTIQTDNFWILINTLTEREPTQLFRSKSSSTTSTGFSPPNNSNDSENRPLVQSKVGPPNLEILNPIDNNSIDSNVSSMIDMSLFNADWSIDDFFPLNSGN